MIVRIETFKSVLKFRKRKNEISKVFSIYCLRSKCIFICFCFHFYQYFVFHVQIRECICLYECFSLILTMTNFLYPKMLNSILATQSLQSCMYTCTQQTVARVSIVFTSRYTRVRQPTLLSEVDNYYLYPWTRFRSTDWTFVCPIYNTICAKMCSTNGHRLR